MDTQQNEILQLIKDYVSCSKYMCKILKESYDTKGATLLRARRINIIPKEGILAEGYLFSFHGGGCYFKFEGGSIDIDFGPNDRCDGFDSQRLYEFLKSSQSNKKNSMIDEVSISRMFKYLLEKKIIINPGWYPNPHLFYLNELTTSSGM